MMMKKYASLLFALVLALSLSVSAAADSSGVYVYDDAALLTQEEYDTLNEAAAAVSEQYGCGVYVVTVDDMADYIDPDAVTETGETGMAAFTEYAWDALGLAASYDSNGIMLALSMAERDFQMLAHCDTANADKVVAAAQEQIDAIRRIERDYGLDVLPEKLQSAALLRIANPEASLADLATLSYPPVTKSCLNYRLKKLMEFHMDD